MKRQGHPWLQSNFEADLCYMKLPQKGKGGGGGGGHLCLNKTASPQVIPPGEPEVCLGSKGPAFRNRDPSAAMNALPRHAMLAHCFVAATQRPGRWHTFPRLEKLSS